MSRLKKIVCVLLTLVLLVLAIAGAGRLLNPDWTDRSRASIEAFHAIGSDELEVLVFGSSHAWKGVDTRILQEEYDIASYNYAGNWQHINTTELFLADALSVQTPEVVFIETFRINEVLEDVDMNGEIYYTKSIPYSEAKKNYLKGCFGEEKKRYLSYVMPLYLFHGDWSKLDRENFYDERDRKFYLETCGYEPATSSIPVDFKGVAQGTQHSLSERARQSLDAVVDLCEGKGVKLVFFTVPYIGEYAYADAMAEYAKEKGCDYLNLFDYVEDMGIDGATDFRDETHLSDEGAKKVARFLGEYLNGR